MPVTTPPLSSPMNHVLVDYENVHHLDLAKVGEKPVSFVLLLGPLQTKLAAELIEQLIGMAASVQMVRLSSSGRNAVDFALAYYLGQAVSADPGGYFHLVSKDTGYDPLIAHLRERRIQVRRHESCETLTFAVAAKSAADNGAGSAGTVAMPKLPKKAAKKAVKAAAKKIPAKSVKKAKAALSPDEMLELVKERLKNIPSSLPGRRKTLASRIGGWIGGDPPDETKVREVIKRAEKAGWLSFDEKDHPGYHF